MKIQLLGLLSFFLLHASVISAAPSYLPVGPQTNVPVTTVTSGGWTQCYLDQYADNMVAPDVLAACTGSKLMMACRTTDSSTLTLLAQADRADVIFPTGDNLGETHIANGVGWYFDLSGTDSWGFVKAGDSVRKGNCDTSTAGSNDNRLCWHVNQDQTVGGYRCGITDGLNESTAFERIVYQEGTPVGPAAPAAPIPTMSVWGLGILASLLGLMSFVRRRKA